MWKKKMLVISLKATIRILAIFVNLNSKTDFSKWKEYIIYDFINLYITTYSCLKEYLLGWKIWWLSFVPIINLCSHLEWYLYVEARILWYEIAWFGHFFLPVKKNLPFFSKPNNFIFCSYFISMCLLCQTCNTPFIQ